MKTYAFIIVLLLTSVGFAHGPSTDEMINNMMQAQSVSDLSSLDCSRISVSQMEFLGDAVMERMLGSDELHEQMDAMMGGEGSESLRQIHTAMGLNWLECNSTATNYRMINSGMMESMMMRMMGNYYPAYYNGFDSVLLLALIGWVLFAVMLIYHFRPIKHHKGHRRT
ncbi:MAG: hypothetical protein HY513_01875 [Candidatus Aenigmarchaeota archaeon]|nr:hypothetical protein [Candidatus Aenigmarchaeota archaeon]